MKIRELVKLLSAEPNQDREVIMSIDAEGNGHSPLSSLWCGRYRAETTWYGQVGIEELDLEWSEQGFTDEDVMTDGVPALILTPVN